MHRAARSLLNLHTEGLQVSCTILTRARLNWTSVSPTHTGGYHLLVPTEAFVARASPASSLEIPQSGNLLAGLHARNPHDRAPTWVSFAAGGAHEYVVVCSVRPVRPLAGICTRVSFCLRFVGPIISLIVAISVGRPRSTSCGRVADAWFPGALL